MREEKKRAGVNTHKQRKSMDLANEKKAQKCQLTNREGRLYRELTKINGLQV